MTHNQIWYIEVYIYDLLTEGKILTELYMYSIVKGIC